QVRNVLRSMPTSDGAGVRLTRVIGTPQLPQLDPFLLLDEFGTDRPEDYIAGFPAHPHRGFETVTYMLDGRMRHRDNHGNEGVLVPGAVQWMTAGRGIVHSEMPEQEEGRMRGFQLWVNLPAKDKMTAPRYQELGPEHFPEQEVGEGVRVKVIAGQVGGVTGPISQPATDPTYLDVRLGAGAAFAHVAGGPQRLPVRVRGFGAGRRWAGGRHHRHPRDGGAGPGRAGARRRPRGRYPPDSGRGPAAQRAGGALWSLRHEHPGRTAPGIRGLPGRALLSPAITRSMS